VADDGFRHAGFQGGERSKSPIDIFVLFHNGSKYTKNRRSRTRKKARGEEPPSLIGYNANAFLFGYEIQQAVHEERRPHNGFKESEDAHPEAGGV